MTGQKQVGHDRDWTGQDRGRQDRIGDKSEGTRDGAVASGQWMKAHTLPHSFNVLSFAPSAAAGGHYDRVRITCECDTVRLNLFLKRWAWRLLAPSGNLIIIS